MRNENKPKQKYFLGEVITIKGIEYTVSVAEYVIRASKDDALEIWYRLLGPVSFYKYEDELDMLVGIDAQERAQIDGEHPHNWLKELMP